ncbi:MAG: rod shape-determining protein MreC [Minisyncoccia bacterium]|jgi:cell shape-determining protein MreC
MKSFRLLILSVAFVAVVLVVFFSRTVIVHFFQNFRLAFSGAADSEFTYENYGNLKAQNEVLTQSFSGAENANPTVNADRYRAKEAQVFSDYPFNNYAAITIDIGSDDGIKVGMPVLSAPGVLLGKIKDVKRTESEVETIFDPAWRSAVAFGTNRAKALLTGGPAPYLDLIPKDASSTAGDAVMNLASNFPMNSLIGRILDWEAGENGVWAKAKVEPPISFEDLRKVLVIINFP